MKTKTNVLKFFFLVFILFLIDIVIPSSVFFKIAECIHELESEYSSFSNISQPNRDDVAISSPEGSVNMQNAILLEEDISLDITSDEDSFDYNWTINEDSSTYDSNDYEFLSLQNVIFDDIQNENLEVEYEPLLDEPDEELEDHEIALRLLRFFVEFERLPHSTSRIYGGLGPEYDGQDPQPEWLNNPFMD